MRRLALRLLGEFEARQGALGPLALRLAKSRALLAYLALSEDHMISRGRLCDLLWSRVDRRQARQSLRQAIADVRNTLGSSSTVLVTEEDAVGLDRDRLVCDVNLFERLASKRRHSALNRAARLYRGTFLAGIDLSEPAFDDWRDSEQRRLDALARTVLARLYELCDRDNAGAAIALASRLVTVDPYDEAVHRALMTLYARSGAKREALRQFEFCRRELRDGLDQEPSPETVAMCDAIRRSEDAFSSAPETVREKAIAAVPGSARRLRVFVPAAIIALTIAGIAAWQATQTQSPVVELTSAGDPVLSMPTGPVIAVLPFENVSGDPGHDYFSAGLTEDLITQLSRFPQYLVVARDATHQYQGSAVDVREVGRDLGARYIIRGSVRGSDENIRVTAKVLDAETGGSLWADSYDRDLSAGALFEIQDEITERISGIIASDAGVLSRFEWDKVAAKGTNSLTVYECVVRAENYYNAISPAEHAAVRDCLEDSTEIDPNYSDVWAWLTHMYLDEHKFSYNTLPGSLDRALNAGKRAVEVDETNQYAHEALATAYFFRHELDTFRVEAERTLSLNPNESRVLAWMGALLLNSGNQERGYKLLRKAMALNPYHPRWYYLKTFIYWYGKREYETALAEARKAALGLGDYYETLYQIAAALGQLGRVDEAKPTIDRLLEVYPNFPERAAEELGNWNYSPDLVAHIIRGLNKAGLPQAPEPASRPVIAVLPFTNMSGNPDQEYFADGITEDIITRLSRFGDLAVIARNSTFQYKGQAVDARSFGELLGVDYVVEGSVRRSPSRVRVTAQLLVAADGTHVWAESWDRDLSVGDIFDIQDEITNGIVVAIAGVHGAIARTSADRLTAWQGEPSLSAYDCVLVAYQWVRLLSQESYTKAEGCLESTLPTDPDYAEAHAAYSYVTGEGYSSGYKSRHDRDELLRRALAAGERAVSLAPANGWAHWAFANALFLARNLEGFRAQAARAVELNPHNSLMLGAIGANYCFAGDYAICTELIDKAMVHDPFHPDWWNFGLGKEQWARGDYQAALETLSAINLPGYYWTHIWRVVFMSELGRTAEAEVAVAELLGLYPGTSVAIFRESARSFNFPEAEIEIGATMLRNAGLPEGG
jgi:TolB-like protein/DNA-binding SARP family transcriptional activator